MGLGAVSAVCNIKHNIWVNVYWPGKVPARHSLALTYFQTLPFSYKRQSCILNCKKTQIKNTQRIMEVEETCHNNVSAE